MKESERPGLSGLSFLEVDEEPEEALPDKAALSPLGKIFLFMFV